MNKAESLCKSIDPLVPQKEMTQHTTKGLKPAITRYKGIGISI